MGRAGRCKPSTVSCRTDRKTRRCHLSPLSTSAPAIPRPCTSHRTCEQGLCRCTGEGRQRTGTMTARCGRCRPGRNRRCRPSDWKTCLRLLCLNARAMSISLRRHIYISRSTNTQRTRVRHKLCCKSEHLHSEHSFFFFFVSSGSLGAAAVAAAAFSAALGSLRFLDDVDASLSFIASS